jgi:hypothetical protein
MAKVLVFGANRAGIHGKGSALEAYKKWGAIYGQGEGRQGNSYGIPTKLTPYITLPLSEIKKHVDTFIQYATEHPDDSFIVVRIGCCNAGYTDLQISPMFKTVPTNVILPDDWKNKEHELTMDDIYNAN